MWVTPFKRKTLTSFTTREGKRDQETDRSFESKSPTFKGDSRLDETRAILQPREWEDGRGSKTKGRSLYLVMGQLNVQGTRVMLGEIFEHSKVRSFPTKFDGSVLSPYKMSKSHGDFLF
ncbi:hypothetical protein AMTR_s00129p00040930 [Amborella trichopoda]|uniref:Uncharacterized protein n=1 Tax=Amborella trichopoda TaxID=13333 RepID=W1NKK1_AMBTC|nr:hypothetical protein AMTR_s00129p00040930 [Amborella trichopoda]